MKNGKKGFIQLLSIPYTWLIIAIIVAIFFLPKLPNLFSIFYDDYLIEDDFMIEGYTKEHWSNIGISPQLVGYHDGFLQLNANDYVGSDTTYNVNLKNRDIKTKVSFSASACTPDFSTGFSINLGNKEVFSYTGSGLSFGSDFLIELIKDVTDKNKFVVIVNGEAVKELTIPEDEALISYHLPRTPHPCKSGSQGATLIIDFLNSRPYFSCIIDDNEVVVRDSFNEGSTFDIHSLTYEPTKFCPQDYPTIVRDYSAGGAKTDIRGTITEGLARGKSYTVPTNQVYEVMYGTLYKEGMAEKCLIGQVYDADLNKCVQKAIERDVIEKIIREKEIIKVGKNQKYFTNSLKIGDKTISAGIPNFICNDEGEDWNAPYPNSECWQNSVTALGTSYTMKDGNEVNLNPYFDLKLYISGHYESDIKRVDSHINHFVLTIKNYDFITLSIIRDEYYVIKDSAKNMCFNIINDLDINFDSKQAGYSLLKTTDLIVTQERIINEKELPAGTTNYCIPLDTDMYGEIIYEVIPYFKLGSEIFFDNEKIIYNYKIVDRIPECSTADDCSIPKGCVDYSTDCVNNKCEVICVSQPDERLNLWQLIKQYGLWDGFLIWLSNLRS